MCLRQKIFGSATIKGIDAALARNAALLFEIRHYVLRQFSNVALAVGAPNPMRHRRAAREALSAP